MRKPLIVKVDWGKSSMGEEHSGTALYGILKWILVALLAVFIITRFSFEKTSSTDFEEMESAVLAASDLEGMQEGGNQMFKRLYKLDPADYDGICLWYPDTNMGAEELLLVKLKSSDQMDEVAAAAESRVESQIGVFEGYGIEQTEMLQESEIVAEGSYVLLVVADDTAPVVQAFRDAY